MSCRSSSVEAAHATAIIIDRTSCILSNSTLRIETTSYFGAPRLGSPRPM
jgi:hypothetical protein